MIKYVLCLLVAVMLFVGGCGMPVNRIADPMPNTGAGFWTDVAGTADAMIQHHERNIVRNSDRDLLRAVENTEEKLSRISRLKRRLHLATLQYDGNSSN